MILVSLGYVAFLVLLVMYERHRVRRQHVIDFLTLFVILFGIQAIVPPLVVTMVLGVHGHHIDTVVPFSNRVLRDVDTSVALVTLLMTIAFTAVVYVTWWLLKRVFIGRERPYAYSFSQAVAPRRWAAVMLVGVALMLWLLGIAGGGFHSFKDLIDLRMGREITRTAGYIFYITTQAFSMLSVIGVVLYAYRRNYIRMSLCVMVMLFFAAMSVSRREILIDVFLLYFTYVLSTQRWHLKYLLVLGLLSLVVLLFGKPALIMLSTQQTFAFSVLLANSRALDIWSALARSFADAGRTVTDSWATLMYLDIPPRFGLDHFLSLMRLFGGRVLGLNLDLPERIVRISTAAFVSPTAQDEPPGLMGQMWLDFRFFGPLVWGVTFAFQLATLQRMYNRSRKSLEVVTLYLVLFYIVTLVLNTGSYDFTFSWNWVLFILLSVIVCTTRWHVALGLKLHARYQEPRPAEGDP